MSGPRRFDQSVKNSPRGLVILHRTFGMPLHCQYEMVGGSSFQGLDDSILRTTGHNAKSVSSDFSRLVMAEIDLHGKLVYFGLGARAHDRSETRFCIYLDGVRDRYGLPRLVINRRFNVLQQG